MKIHSLIIMIGLAGCVSAPTYTTPVWSAEKSIQVVMELGFHTREKGEVYLARQVYSSDHCQRAIQAANLFNRDHPTSKIKIRCIKHPADEEV